MDYRGTKRQLAEVWWMGFSTALLFYRLGIRSEMAECMLRALCEEDVNLLLGGGDMAVIKRGGVVERKPKTPRELPTGKPQTPKQGK